MLLEEEYLINKYDKGRNKLLNAAQRLKEVLQKKRK